MGNTPNSIPTSASASSVPPDVANNPSTWQKIKQSWLNNPISNAVTTTLAKPSEWAEERRQANLKAAAEGKPLPYSENVTTWLDEAGTLGRMTGGLTQPKNLILLPAAEVAPLTTSAAIASQGVKGLLTPKQPGETEAQYEERKLMSASMAFGAPGGAREGLDTELAENAAKGAKAEFQKGVAAKAPEAKAAEAGHIPLGKKPAPEPVGVHEDDLPYRAKYQDVDFSAKDLQDTGKTVNEDTIRKDYAGGKKNVSVYKSYIPMEDLPSSKFVEPEEAEFGREDYRNPRAGVPIKVQVNKDGSLEILDGNHRAQVWSEQDQQYAPAWVIDKRHPNIAHISANEQLEREEMEAESAEPTELHDIPGAIKIETAPQGGHAGGGVASVEELNRPGRFVKVSRSGNLTDQGKTPDFNLRAGEAGYQVLPDGTFELRAGQESLATKLGIQRYAKEQQTARLKSIPGAQIVTKSSGLPPQPALPEAGQVAAIRTDDGGIYPDKHANEGGRTHVQIIQDYGIPPERVTGGGWLSNGVYEDAGARSDAGRFGEQARAKKTVERKHASAELEKIPGAVDVQPAAPGQQAFYHGTNAQAAEHIAQHGFGTPERIGGIAPGSPEEERQLTFISPHKAGADYYANNNLRSAEFGGPKTLQVNFDPSHTFSPTGATSIYAAARQLGVKELPDGQIDFADFRQKMKDAGYDAVAFRDPHAGNRKVIAVFEPEKLSVKGALKAGLQPIRAYHGTAAAKNFQDFDTEGRQYDEEGNPLTSGSGADPTSYLGAHFAKESNVANKFAEHNQGWLRSRFEAGEGEEGAAGPRVIPVDLHLKNPITFGSESNMRNFIYQGELSGYAGDELLNRAMQYDGIEIPEEGGEDVDNWMKKYNYDPVFRTDQNQWIFEQYRPEEGEEDLQHEAAQDLARDARSRLEKMGHDGAIYTNEVEGGTGYIAFSPNQIKSVFKK